jgi:fatty-acid peroxygenase
MPEGPVTYARVRELPYLERVTREVRRARTVVPVTFFARAKADCEFEGVAVPRGMKAIGAIGATLHDGRLFPEPDVFDPDRWLPERASVRQNAAWVPHGSGEHLSGHRCAGERMAELMLKAFAVVTLRDFDWDLPSDQTFASTTGQLFATPAGGLRVRFRRI